MTAHQLQLRAMPTDGIVVLTVISILPL